MPAQPTGTGGGSDEVPAARPAHCQVTFWIGKRDRAGHHSLMVELFRRARRAGIAGATAFEASEGFGASGRLHRPHLVSDDSPIAVVMIDTRPRVDGFLEEVADLLDQMFVVVEDVEVVGGLE
jgi:PII-like signaling protein